MTRGEQLMLCFIAAATLGCWHWVKWEGPAKASPHCRRSMVLSMLDTIPQPTLSGFDMFIARVSTPFKRRGLSGWRETYCEAYAEGLLVRDAQHSTDGFWTMDLHLSLLAISPDTLTPERKFIRIEVEPGTLANRQVTLAPPLRGDCVGIGGIVVIDTDANFLEIHPDTIYQRIARSDSLKKLVRDTTSSIALDRGPNQRRCMPQGLVANPRR